jgi:hypothetical protein
VLSAPCHCIRFKDLGSMDRLIESIAFDSSATGIANLTPSSFRPTSSTHDTNDSIPEAVSLHAPNAPVSPSPYIPTIEILHTTIVTSSLTHPGSKYQALRTWPSSHQHFESVNVTTQQLGPEGSRVTIGLVIGIVWVLGVVHKKVVWRGGRGLE